MGSTSAILNRCVRFAFTFGSLSRCKFYAKKYEGKYEKLWKKNCFMFSFEMQQQKFGATNAINEQTKKKLFLFSIYLNEFIYCCRHPIGMHCRSVRFIHMKYSLFENNKGIEEVCVVVARK